MPTRLLFFLLLFFISLEMIAGEYRNYNFPFFFGRQPSARSEAMGRALIIDKNNPFAGYYNPALISQNEGVNFGFSYANPYYLADDASYNFEGMTLEIPNVGTLGLSRFHFTYGLDVTYIDPIDFNEKTYIPATTQYTISFSRSVWTHLYWGLNINRYTDVFRADKTTSSYPVDVGLLNYFPLKQSSNRKAYLALHASLTNVFSATITITEKELLPRILRLGGAFQLKQHPLDHLERLYFLAFTLVWEYQDVLDYPYRHGNKFGAELSLLEILHLRTGYYSFKIDPSPENGKGKLNDLTYGFGISLPWGTLLKSERVPITLKFDFISIGQPTYITNFDDWDNFIIYNLSVVWTW